MALHGNGQLLVNVRRQPFSTAAAVVLRDYAVEPLSPAPQARPTFNATAPGNHWLLAKPAKSIPDPNPWDTAHAAASAIDYRHYIEPDIAHERAPRPAN